MGVETALLIGAGISAGTGAISSIMSGNAAYREAQTASFLEQLNTDITRRETDDQMRVRTEEMTRLKETQKLAMLHSGMVLAGSPLLILEDTKRQLALELDSIKYKNDVENYASKLRQQNYLSSGRSALIGGYVNAIESVANFAVDAYNAKGSSTKNSAGAKKIGYSTSEYGYNGSLGGLA